MEHLLKLKAQLNYEDPNGMTALILAAQVPHTLTALQIWVQFREGTHG